MATRSKFKVASPPVLTDDDRRIHGVATDICVFAHATCQCVVDRGYPRCDQVIHMAKIIDARYMAKIDDLMMKLPIVKRNPYDNSCVPKRKRKRK